MQNFDRIKQAYTNLCMDLVNATNDLDSFKNYDDYDETLKTVDTISVILKRLGETNVLEFEDEVVEENVEGKEE